jgi:hypothetical protein
MPEMQECRNARIRECKSTAQSRLHECKNVQMHAGTKGMMAMPLPLPEEMVA